MEEQVEELPEAVAEVEVGLPGSVAPAAAVASWLLPAAPTESDPAAASAETRFFSVLVFALDIPLQESETVSQC